MDDLQFLKDEITSSKFNKRIFYAKNALKYIEIMPINFFIDKYIPYIVHYIYYEENVEEVLTEYSKTFIVFLKFMGKEEVFQKYTKAKNSKEEEIVKDRHIYNNSINIILKCIFEKILLNDDEILRESTINNLKELLLEIDEFPLLKKELELVLSQLNIINSENTENKDINEENEIKILLFSLLYPFVIIDEKKLENYCNKYRINISNNSQRKKKRLLVQNIINIIPFIKNSIDKIINSKEQNSADFQNIINKNIYLLKEILSSISVIMDDKNLIISVGMNYFFEIILSYTIENTTEIILFYEQYNKYLSNKEIDLIITNFVSKLESLINNETTLKVSLTWRVKVSYVENICKLKKLVNNHNPNYFKDYFSSFCKNALNGNSNEPDLKISILNNSEILIPTINSFLPIFSNIIIMEQNKYIVSSLAVALNKILNNKQLYEIYNNKNDMMAIIISQIFQFIHNLINRDNFEIKYYLFSSFEFSFFTYINDDFGKIWTLNETIKLYVLVFQKINEWRIRHILFQKFEKFLLEKENFLKLFSLYQQAKNEKKENDNIFEVVKNIRFLIQIFFLDKANIIRTNCLEFIKNIINFQVDNKINEDICLIRINQELIKYQVSIFYKNSFVEENIINNLNLLDTNKNYFMKLFFLESVKKFIHLYSNNEKSIIKEILSLINRDIKYGKENVARNKINSSIDEINEKLKEINL